MIKLKRLLAVSVLLVFSALNSQADEKDAPTRTLSSTTKATFLFYISADSPGLFSEHEFHHRLLNRFDRQQNPVAQNYNALILFDPWLVTESPRLTLFRNGVRENIPIPRNILDPLVKGQENDPSINMGKEQTLKWFFSQLSEKNIQSEHYILTFDGHGNSWMGFGVDTQGSNKYVDGETSFLTTLNITDSIRSSLPLPNGKRKFDAVIFNACLMGSAEVLYEFKDLTDYYMASSVPVPLVGTDFKADNYFTYSNYGRFNLKFPLVSSAPSVRLQGASFVETLLQGVMESRIVFHRKPRNRSESPETWSTSTTETRFTKAPTERKSSIPTFDFDFPEHGVHSHSDIARENYFWINLQEYSNFIENFPRFTQLLSEFIHENRRKKPDFFGDSQLYTKFNLLGRQSFVSGILSDLKKLLEHIVKKTGPESQYLATDVSSELHQLARNLLDELNAITHTVNNEEVAFMSIFMPSLSFINYSAFEGTSFTKGNHKYTFSLLSSHPFQEEMGWDGFIDEYIKMHKNRQTESPNTSQSQFLNPFGDSR